jgi:hypothetical protein
MDQTEITASPKLRTLFLVVSLAMFVLWGLSLIPPIRAWGDPNEDGFSYLPAFWATITCLPVGLYCWPALLSVAAARSPALAPRCSSAAGYSCLWWGS